MKAIHAVNAALWHPGEQAQKSQTDKQTDKSDDYYVPRGAAARLGNNLLTPLYRTGTNTGTEQELKVNDYRIVTH